QGALRRRYRAVLLRAGQRALRPFKIVCRVRCRVTLRGKFVAHLLRWNVFDLWRPMPALAAVGALHVQCPAISRNPHFYAMTRRCDNGAHDASDEEADTDAGRYRAISERLQGDRSPRCSV